MTDADARPPLASHQIGVLLVEDDALLRMDISDKLEAFGLAVFEARDADAALAILATRSDIRVMITDVDFISGPMNGFDLAQRVTREWPGVGLIITSGRARPTLGDLPPGSRFLPKPCSPRDLRSTVFALVELEN
ncbi:response regulator [Methylobacterium sp. J-030]|uniref:response regulator n=1 Tax=Methylobacterium sp. J-030 TaxID=2836627 RepID=UPI001FB9FD53|nr:response regulator [Methylobacterium sp. J-030]MCJ2069353.1 response regulator [Methylobacterium sp. J-030]